MASQCPAGHYTGPHCTAEEGADSGRHDSLEINHSETQTSYFLVTKVLLVAMPVKLKSQGCYAKHRCIF